ncbi:hypothetical protein IE81DRAFT_347513 [Ceraceosorus guamensis]|uniref:NAD(P)-binding protein n=1 Tax=Ceraceosorus guamensis TaxID=1522189 RepID=A0A316W0Z8_9BASI|nr:hypothetical protein IE81DRAFT_347513 [Ceraceosorus guamensis]PWN42413.1 hypothetical protein IE81DRAFT_347513 [Ceraceosorus guamensis]
MSSSIPKIVLFGGTGFVGGQVLYTLLTGDFSLGEAEIVVITSSESKHRQIDSWASKLGSKLQGRSLSVIVAQRGGGKDGNAWYEASEKISSDADLVLQAATSDDLKLTKAINKGLISAQKSGKRGALIHLSGTQLIETLAGGNAEPKARQYDDSDRDAIVNISDEAAHRHIDLEIGHVIARGELPGAIVCPTLVWGQGQGPDLRVSTQIPDLVKKALYNGHAVHVGAGTNSWTSVHVSDVSSLILLLSASLLSPTSSGKASKQKVAGGEQLFESFYFASTPKLHLFKDLASVIGKTLHAQGLISSSQPTSLPCPAHNPNEKGVRIEDAARSAADEEQDKRTPIWPTRTNVDCIASRAEREVSWKPTKHLDEEGLVADVKFYVEQWRADGTLKQLQRA